MRIFLDTAEVSQIQEAANWGVISGVTTNPTLIAKSGRDFHQVIAEICALVDGPISAEVMAQDEAGMVAEARELAKISEQVVIKIPITQEGLIAVRKLKTEGIRTNATLVFSTAQAILAARAGASFVSPFLGRLDDCGQEGMGMLAELVQAFGNYDLDCEIIAASVRHPIHFTQAALVGADIATVPMEVLRQLFNHPLTIQGIEKFLADWQG